MNTHPDCERARLAVMAALDHELETPSESRGHVTTCAACREWLDEMNAIQTRLQTLTYPRPRTDVWRTVERRLREDAAQAPGVARLWPIGAAVLVWRALQLFIDLPAPWLHPIVPVAAAALALWRLGRGVLSIETSAPELQKRGI
jgi:hypothetical protein